MHRGYVKLWRKVEDAGWLRNHKLWCFWSWCLIKASRKEHAQKVGYQEVNLMPGQFVFGRKRAAEELGMSEQNVRTCAEYLAKSRNITIKSTNKYSIITLVNWAIYQNCDDQTNQQYNQPLTNNQPTSNQQVTTNKKGKKGKNEKNTKPPISPLPEFIPIESWEAFTEMRRSLNKPVTPKAASLIWEKLKRIRDGTGASPGDVLDQSTMNSWQGVFELKDNNNGKGTTAVNSIELWRRKKEAELRAQGREDEI